MEFCIFFAGFLREKIFIANFCLFFTQKVEFEKYTQKYIFYVNFTLSRILLAELAYKCRKKAAKTKKCFYY